MDASLAMKYVWPGKVIQVIDPQFFWMQFTSRDVLQQFERLQKDMQLFARQDWVSSNIEEIEAGMSVLVNTGSAEVPFLKRGQIARIMKNSTVDVFYVDFGNTELTTVDNICTYVPVQFKEFPPQAIKCKLAGVTPLVNSWTSRGIKTFQKLTNDCVMNVLNLYGEHGCLEVSLYPSDESNGRSIAHCLATEEVAMLVEEQPIPEYLCDIPAFINQGYQNDGSPVHSSPSPQTDDVRTGTSPKVSQVSPSAEKYIPPHQKNHTSASTCITNLGASPTGNSGSAMKSPNIVPPQSSQTSSKSKEPVVDFFPFDNVSVYPLSPSSPMKSPSKTTGNGRPDLSQNSSYFSKSPSKHDHYSSSNGTRKSPNTRYSGHEGHSRQQPSRTPHDRHRFAANFDNLPTPANTFEPDYLNTKPVNKSASAPASTNHGSLSHDSPPSDFNNSNRSSNQILDDNKYKSLPRPRLHIPNTNQSPFYPPRSQPGENFQRYPFHPVRSSNPHQMTIPNHPPGLVPPRFYQASPAGQYYPQSGYPGQQMSGQPFTSSTPIQVPGNRMYDKGSNSHHSYTQQSVPDGRYNSNSLEGYDQAEMNTNQNFHSSPNSTRSSGRSSLHYTPTKQGYENPESPESPAIAAFNINELDHTQSLSVEHYHQRSHQERLQVLREEAEDIAIETKEQADLVNIARFGGKHQSPDDEEYVQNDMWGKPDIYEEIEADLSMNSSYKDYDDMKKSPLKKTPVLSPRKSVQTTPSPSKLGEIPVDFVADINFTEAVEEALEYGRTEGMDKAVIFLDHVVELLRKTEIEKQLYDILYVLITKAVEDYNLYHIIVIDTINSLNGEFDIMNCLMKVLKRKQELYVRVPSPKHPCHSDFARVMGLICNLAADWEDNKATAQDSILVTVEKWIVFNRKGTQIGQTDKENIFLDCFIAFWDICGTFLIHHNQAFISRIKSEVRTKLLNGNVDRSIRERLMDILLELFPLRQELVTISTQTPRCTMIPSSCQVKPSTSDKETMVTEDILYEAHYNRDSILSIGKSDVYDEEESNYPSNVIQQSYKQSSFYDSPGNVPDKNKASSIPTYEDKNQYVLDDYNISERFDDDGNADSSVYDNVGSKLDLDYSNNNGTMKDAENHLIKSEVLADGNRANRGNERMSSYSLNKNDPWKDTPGQNNEETVTEKKSMSGKSIVDWFDYEPTSQAASNSGVKLEEKRLENKKKLDITSMGIIENDVGVKYAPLKTDKGKKKSKKEKKVSKSDLEIKPSANDTIDNEDECDNTAQSNSRSHKNSESKETLVAVNEDSGKKYSDHFKGDEYKGADYKGVDTKENTNIDWWGVGETHDYRYIPAGDETYRNNIYIDNGPDVIIEDEFDQSIDNLNDNAGIDNDEKVTSDKMKVTEAKDDIDRNIDPDTDLAALSDEDIEENEMVGKKKRRVGAAADDEFGFQLEHDDEDDDDDWGGESDDDLNINEFVGLNNPQIDKKYDSDFPDISLATISAGCQNENISPVNMNQYERVDTQPKQSPTRWVPGKRKCHNCTSEDHITSDCKVKFNLL
ncbi:Tudor domain-containing protein 6-like [Mactra antiquata]